MFLKKAWLDVPNLQKALILSSVVIFFLSPQSNWERIGVSLILATMLLGFFFFNLLGRRLSAAYFLLIPITLLLVAAIYLMYFASNYTIIGTTI